MLFKETYKLQLLFVLLFGLILIFNWVNIFTRHITVILVTVLFIFWVLSIIIVIVKKTKRR